MSQLRRLRRHARETQAAVDQHTASRLELCVRLGIIDEEERARIVASLREGLSVDAALTRAGLDEPDDEIAATPSFAGSLH
jgi:hypothetical protein